MLINLSNHPSDTWTAEQTQAALATYGGKVEDIPFPPIDPRLGLEEVRNLAAEHVLRCKALLEGQPEPHAIHVMGEMTFLHNFLLMARSEKLTCVASTSERKVHQEESGRKLIEFHFIRFRNYFPE